MTYFGETLRKAREAKGLTTSQVAEKTHILVQIIDAMEKENFSRIKAAIYGRGFVKLICECLEIDPKPLVAEFMDIYEGRRPPVAVDVFQPKPPPPAQPAATTPATTSDEPIVSDATPNEPIVPAAIPDESIVPAATPDEPIVPAATTGEPIVPAAVPEVPTVPDVQSSAEIPETVKGLDLFDPQPPAFSSESPTATRAQDIFSSAYATSEPSVPAGPTAAEKFRTGLSVVSHGVIGSVRRIPRSAWRMAVLTIGAGLVVALLVWGCVILYRVTEQQPATDPVVTPSAAPARPADTKAASKPVPAGTKAATAKPAEKPAAPKATSKTPTAKAAKPPAATPATKSQKPAAAKPQPMRSTGQKVPPLYVD